MRDIFIIHIIEVATRLIVGSGLVQGTRIEAERELSATWNAGPWATAEPGRYRADLIQEGRVLSSIEPEPDYA